MCVCTWCAWIHTCMCVCVWLLFNIQTCNYSSSHKLKLWDGYTWWSHEINQLSSHAVTNSNTAQCLSWLFTFLSLQSYINTTEQNYSSVLWKSSPIPNHSLDYKESGLTRSHWTRDTELDACNSNSNLSDYLMPFRAGLPKLGGNIFVVVCVKFILKMVMTTALLLAVRFWSKVRFVANKENKSGMKKKKINFKHLFFLLLFSPMHLMISIFLIA